MYERVLAETSEYYWLYRLMQFRVSGNDDTLSLKNVWSNFYRVFFVKLLFDSVSLFF